jgi:hypothetical protein
MTLIGTTVKGAVAQALTVDRVVGSSLLLPSGLIAQFTADVDGQRGFTPQLTRVVVYRDATAGLVAVSEPVVIETGQARGWVNYPFSSPLLIAAEESYFVGLQAGGGDAGQGWGAASGGVGYADAYADGPLASRPAGSAAGTVALFATYFQGWVPPTIPDEELAAYGWLSAQRAFGAGSAGAAVSGRAEWQGTWTRGWRPRWRSCCTAPCVITRRGWSTQRWCRRRRCCWSCMKARRRSARTTAIWWSRRTCGRSLRARARAIQRWYR